jgi:hypothetical protein
MSDKQLRSLFQRTKDDIARQYGILCFSRSWENPVQWGHYADRHQGLCLGFEVPDNLATIVSYAAKRLLAKQVETLLSRGIDEELMRTLLTTKYSHWKYEKEVRLFAELLDKDPNDNLYFANFSENLKLNQVIVGARSNKTRSEIADALGTKNKDIEVFKARLAYKTFRVVRNRNEALWN